MLIPNLITDCLSVDSLGAIGRGAGMANLGSIGNVTACTQNPVTPGKSPFSVTNEILVGLLGLADILTIVTIILASDYFYHHVVMDFTRMSDDVATISFLIAALFVGFQYFSSGYTLKNYINTRVSARVALTHWVLIFFVIAWLGFLLKVTADFSRAALTISFAIGAFGVVVNRVVISYLLERAIARGSIALRSAFMICLGAPEHYGNVLAETATNGVRIVGSLFVRPDSLENGRFRDACATLVSDVRSTFEKEKFSEIFIFFPWGRWRALSEIQNALASLPLPVFLFADLEVRQVVSGRATAVGPLRGFEIQRAPLSPLELSSKRLFDIVVASAALILCSPLILATSIGILLETGRPVLFRQGRKGFGDRPFTILKFRTMHCMENGDVIVQAKRNDSRVTRLGAILRRASIDELPQLINVLRGEMSIVGPRPHALAHDNQYDKLIASYAYRRHVKPGLTGWAQVHGLRGETAELGQMEGRVTHDLWYINNWSLWLDIWIILKTLRALLIDRNAY